jgi:hypothetical protein
VLVPHLHIGAHDARPVEPSWCQTPEVVLVHVVGPPHTISAPPYCTRRCVIPASKITQPQQAPALGKQQQTTPDNGSLLSMLSALQL